MPRSDLQQDVSGRLPGGAAKCRGVRCHLPRVAIEHGRDGPVGLEVHDGHHIVYRTRQGAFMSATIAMPGGGVSIVRRDSLFADRYAGNTATHQQYDVHPDGRHFVVVDNSTEDASLVVVTSWLAEVRRQLLP